MTTIKETWYKEDGEPYSVLVPIYRASEKAYTEFVAEHLREWLFRQGCNVETVPNHLLLWQVRNTFATVRARDGITTANPV